MPTTSIIVPCFNEQQTIGLLLQAIYDQTFPRSDMEVIIADGMSTDATRAQITAFRLAHPDLEIRVIDNPDRIIPAALNRLVREARGEYVVRIDAHAKPEPNYVELSVNALRDRKGDVVGPALVIEAREPSWISRSIAYTASHPIGVGNAQNRISSKAQIVDTVGFGAYRRELFDRVGYFNESLLSNEDYEFNTRVREAGGTIWLDPAIRVRYFARPDLPSLAKQYSRYGFWKGQMLLRYPKSLRWRQAIPPLFVASVVFFGLLSMFLPLPRSILALEVSAYLVLLAAVGLQGAVRNRLFSMVFGVPFAIATMHICWGSALLWSLRRRLT